MDPPFKDGLNSVLRRIKFRHKEAVDLDGGVGEGHSLFRLDQYRKRKGENTKRNMQLMGCGDDLDVASSFNAKFLNDLGIFVLYLSFLVYKASMPRLWGSRNSQSGGGGGGRAIAKFSAGPSSILLTPIFLHDWHIALGPTLQHNIDLSFVLHVTLSQVPPPFTDTHLFL